MMENNKEYWINRAIMKQLLTEKNIKKIERQLKKNYKEAIKEIKKELTYLKATNELAEWQKIQLEGTINSINEILNDMATKEEKLLTDTLEELCQQVDEKDKKALEVQLDALFHKVNSELIEEVVKTNWSGLMFSERIWNRRDKLAIKLKEILNKGLIRGDSLQDMARLLADEMNKDFNSAMRLVHTETANVQVQTSLQRYKEAGLDTYEYLECPNKDCCPHCKKLAGQVFKIEEAQVGVNCPPMHPRCHCDIMPPPTVSE